MKNLLSASARRELKRHLSRPCLMIFDFDGVLAPLTVARDKAFPRASTIKRLNRLEENATVAVVSGRGLVDLKKRLRFSPDYAVGNHGTEGLREFRATLAPSRRASRDWLKQLKDIALWPGIDIEDKKYSLSVHFRRAGKPAQMQKALLVRVAALTPRPRVVLGKKVVNLVWAKAANKGRAVQLLIRKTGFSRALYVGDDWTDEDVFKLRDPRVFTIRVGRARDSDARYYLRDQKTMNAFLEELTDLVSSSSG